MDFWTQLKMQNLLSYWCMFACCVYKKFCELFTICVAINRKCCNLKCPDRKTAEARSRADSTSPPPSVLMKVLSGSTTVRDSDLLTLAISFPRSERINAWNGIFFFCGFYLRRRKSSALVCVWKYILSLTLQILNWHNFFYLSLSCQNKTLSGVGMDSAELPFDVSTQYFKFSSIYIRFTLLTNTNNFQWTWKWLQQQN